MKYKRSFIFIRPDYQTAFYSDTVDFISQLRAAIPTQIEITSGNQNLNCYYVSFWFPELQDYDWFTENLYINGELKLIFRNAMIHAKTNRLAFCLPSVNLQNTPVKKFTRCWYYHVKQSEEKFYDATPGQKQALKLLTHIISMPESIHSVTIFDYDHNIKFTENALLSSISEDSLRRRFYRMQQRLFPTFTDERQKFNLEHRIDNLTVVDSISRLSSKFTLDPIRNILPDQLKDLVIDLEL